MLSSQPQILQLSGISKSYPGVRALKDVSLRLEPGTVTGLAGENGAGKSTLIKVLSGAVVADSGTAALGGAPLPANPAGVIQAGISVIYQELTDIPEMSIADNVLLGRQPNRAGAVNRRARDRVAVAALGRVGLGHLDISEPVKSLTIAQRQLVEIARCLAREARVLVFDEPTSSLPEADVHALMSTIRELRNQGLAILYVTHHLDEMFAVTDRIIVMRDGALVAEKQTSEWNEGKLVTAMLARDLQHAYPWRDRPRGELVLETDQIDAPGVRSASVTAHAGEIVGLIGLAGAGRTELMKAIAGAHSVTAGSISISGRTLKPGSITSARNRGVIYAPEDRKQEGLVLGGTVQDNLVFGLYPAVSRLGLLRPRSVERHGAEQISRFGIKTDSLRQQVGRLSGGNQQKVILSRVSANKPKVVLLDDPTRGVDVGAKAAIYEQVLNLAAAGTAVLLASSDTDEVLAMSDRAYVLRNGRVVSEYTRDGFDREAMLHHASVG
ncbi:sugar ABC transporter ATP-binding protein [Arthrobacter sp. NPDC093128]|uniref:sugar ABC transporter ATP-binding protein n=1 Tax=Arthrobacter sp. NPDC093128 TaxID=3154979 RepID=UPI00343447B3